MTTGSGSPLAGVNTFALLSLLAAVLFAPVGIVLGAIALRQIAQTGERGRELALVGIWIGIGVTLLALIIVALAAGVVVWAFSLLEGLPR